MSNLTRKPKKSETLEVRLPHDTKQDFLTACREDGTTASEVVRESIQTYLDARLRPEPQTQTAKILTMIPQPIRKKRYLAAGVGALGLAAMLALPSAAAPDFRSVFQSLDVNRDGVLSADEFGGPKAGPNDKNVIIEKRIIKNADGETVSETETITPADGPPGSKQVRIERVEKRADTPEEAAKAGKGLTVTEDAVAYWLPGETGKDGKEQHRIEVSSHRQVVVHGDDRDGPPDTVNIRPNEFAAFDTDRDGKVSYDEFQARHAKMLERGFQLLDANSDGSLSAAEYAKITSPPVLKVKGVDGALAIPDVPKIDGVLPPISAETVKGYFVKLDKNGDGKLSLQEYMPPA